MALSFEKQFKQFQYEAKVYTDKMSKQLAREIAQILKRAIRDVLEKDNKVATGQLQRSIGYRVQPIIKGYLARVTAKAEHAAVVATGRPAGRKPPPASAIAEWIQAKGIVYYGSLDAAAWAIARAIGKRGIPSYDYLQKGFDKAEPEIIKLLKSYGLRRK